MHCPFCSAEDTKVIDSRLSNDGEQVRRRRQCIHCSERFTTYEGAELNMPRVVKQDGSRMPFKAEKLSAGVMRALEKRPVNTEKIEEALNRIKHQLLADGIRETSSARIGDLVMEELLLLDQVAYIRFASVYLDFADAKAFSEMVENIEKTKAVKSRKLINKLSSTTLN